MPNPKFTTFYIVRHGQSQWNVEKRIQGHVKEIPLTENGKSQAKEAANKLQGIKFDLAFSSDLLRAQQTAKILVLEHKLAIISTEALRERHYGGFQGKTYEAVETHYKLLDKLSDEARDTYKKSLGFETDEELISRIITFLRETAIAHPGKTILVVSHGGVMRRLLIHLGFSTYEELQRGAVSNSAIIKLKTDGVDFLIEEAHGVQKNTMGDGVE